MQIITLLIISLLPGFLFIIYILHMDKNEPEPKGTILLALLLGALSCFPAGFMEMFLEKLFPIFQVPPIGGVLMSFLVIAPVEELAKLSVVLLFIWRNKNFNEENDGIVYVGMSALGFAMFENVLYVVSSGITVGIMRAFTAMPLHTFTGVIMGYFIGLAKFSPNKAIMKKNILKGFFIAYLIHAVYDAVIFAFSGSALLMIIIIVILLIIFGIRYLKKGRQLSLERWKNPENINESIIENKVKRLKYKKIDTCEDETGKYYLIPRKKIWKIIVSRITIALSLLIWLILILTALDQPKSVPQLISIEDFKIKIIDELQMNKNKDIDLLLNSFTIKIPEKFNDEGENFSNIYYKNIYKYYDHYFDNKLKKDLSILDVFDAAYNLYMIEYDFVSNCKLKEDLTDAQLNDLFKIISKTSFILTLFDFILVGIIFTLLPMIIALLLEISYYKRKKHRIYLK